MLLKEIRLAFRRIITDINYSIINLIGLTISISFSFLIYIYISDETSFDQHIPDADNIYRISSDFELSGHRDIYSNAPRPMGPALVDEFPSILAATKIMGYNGLQNHSGYIRSNEKTIHSPHLFAADSNFLKVFNLPLLEGNANGLHHPNTTLISEAMALKLFGKATGVIGEKIKLENEMTVEVSGVIKEQSQPTYLPFEVIVSYTTFYSTSESEIWWYGGHVYTYVRTQSDFDPELINENWQPFYDKYMKSTFDELNGTAKIIFQPLRKLYLSPEFIWEPYPHGSMGNIRIFASIAIFLLVVAGFNYINLSLSHSYYKQDEVWVRKVLGASKSNIVRQQLLESLILSFFTSLLSISLLSTIFPLFTDQLRHSYPFSFIKHPGMIAMIFGMSALLAIFSNIYPATYLARHFKYQGPSEKKIIIRRIFVTGQQVIAIVLIVCTLVVVDQINYLKNMDVGFDQNGLILVNIRDSKIKKNLDAFQHSVDNIAGVLGTTRIDETPRSGPNEFTYLIQNKNGEYVSNPSQTLEVGLNFLSTLGMELIAGRPFSREDHEYQGVIINSFLAEKLGYEFDEVIGVKIKFGEDDERSRSVIGVVKDFRMGSAQQMSQSMTLGYWATSNRHLMIRLQPGHEKEVLDLIRDEWLAFGSDLPFQYAYVSDEFDFLLEAENRLYSLLIIGSVLIIFISCLGLLGLTAHTVAHRTKEIGIRKVMGAGSIQLYLLILKDFFKTYLIALLIGLLIAWFIATWWLENYPVRVNFDMINYGITSFISFTIILLTLSFHAVKAIYANPAESLRDE